MFTLSSPDVRGRRRKESGDNAEAIVALHWSALFKRGVAWLYKLPTPYRVVRAQGGAAFQGAWTSTSPFDYCGYTKSGRFVAVEVKRFQANPLKTIGFEAIRLELKNIESHQRMSLAGCAEAGGLAFVVLVAACGPNHRLFAVPWRVVAQAIHNGACSISEDTLIECEVPSGSVLLEKELGAS